jgi:hypothetical protein
MVKTPAGREIPWSVLASPPIACDQPKLCHKVALVALAGLPAVVGVWIGGFVNNI